MPQLTWLGDSDAKRAARKVPYRLLDAVEQVGDPSSENLLIQGDNLEALKALLPFSSWSLMLIRPAHQLAHRSEKFCAWTRHMFSSSVLSMIQGLDRPRSRRKKNDARQSVRPATTRYAAA